MKSVQVRQDNLKLYILSVDTRSSPPYTRMSVVNRALACDRRNSIQRNLTNVVTYRPDNNIMLDLIRKVAAVDDLNKAVLQGLINVNYNFLVCYNECLRQLSLQQLHVATCM